MVLFVFIASDVVIDFVDSILHGLKQISDDEDPTSSVEEFLDIRFQVDGNDAAIRNSTQILRQIVDVGAQFNLEYKRKESSK